MGIAEKAALVTGANRGIGQALVEEALRRGAKRVYAGTRQPLAQADSRVTPLLLDVTNAANIEAAVSVSTHSLRLFITATTRSPLSTPRDCRPPASRAERSHSSL